MKQNTKKWVAALLAGLLGMGTLGALPAAAETEGEVGENDTIATAEVLPLDTAATGGLSSDDDADYYQFTLEESSLLQFQFLTEESDWVYQFNLTFLDENGVLINQWKGILNTQTESYAYRAGTYYCRVEKYANSSKKNYTLTVHSTPQSQWSTTGDYEIEPNNSRSEATSVLLNTPIVGTLLTKEDEDYYQITTETDGVLQLQFQNDPISSTYNQWELLFLDANGKQLSSWSIIGDNGNVLFPAYGCHAGTYYCKIQRSSLADKAIQVNYTLTAAFYTASERETMFETESNDSFATANVVSANTAISGNLFTKSDSDTYQVTLDTASRLTVQFDHALLGDGTASPWTLKLYHLVNQSAELIQTCSSADNMASTTFDPVRSYPGTYYLQISSEKNFNAADYTVTFQAEEISYTQGDVNANNSIEITDAFLALLASSRASAGTELGLSDAEFLAADVDTNGEISIHDAFCILLYSSQLAAGKAPSWEDIV